MTKLGEWKREIGKHKNLILMSLFFLLVALILNYLALNYIEEKTGVVVQDLILDNIPTIDLSPIFIYGFVFIITIFILYPLFFKVNEFHKALSQLSLLVMIRSIFMCFTHLAIPLGETQFIVPKLASFFTSENDLFFSAHTSIPFLGFLLFKDKRVKYFFLTMSIIMAIVVLLMHIHYSIDVFSAFFIAYGSFKIGEWFFNKINHYNNH